MENLSVTGFREPEIQDICFPGNRRFPGMSVRLSAKTEGRAQPPEIGASPESVIIRIFFYVLCQPEPGRLNHLFSFARFPVALLPPFDKLRARRRSRSLSLSKGAGTACGQNRIKNNGKK
ncbi:Uncharacterized protein dnm_045210 [Desulfonema magnum]|uniref:Uncharacterized protein n=1 Tax=Desulfonema magnum TaxID=45655 RepID=A0A975BN28_9BACT|nr:Uncharacterized protein dnm_045210 [Desulfonema magnum]